MLSPSLSVTTPDGANLHPASSRRRALSYLRNFSQSRSGADSPTETPRTSPRSYFQRSTSYTEPRNQSASSNSRRRRSASRPNEPTHLADAQVNSVTPSSDNHRRAASPSEEDRLPPTRLGFPDDSDDQDTDTMARNRPSGSHRNPSSTTQEPDAVRQIRQTPNRSTSQANGESQEADPKSTHPTIRLFPHQEVRSNGRNSLNFTPVSRTLPSEHSIIRVGRYSEREGIPTANPTGPSDAPVGFKSKVVSRKHCEFTFLDGQWHIRDVASSSGTFLNHIRLSQPNTESRQFPIKDGDIVQLGIDFRGGEEMIFRCVKIRIECNRSWQKKPNNFNKSRHAQLQMLAKDQQAAAGTNSGECSICLGSVLPCQSLFVAPCAHCWHYKCIRPLLEGKNSTYPQFQCPNCRAYTDLTADVDVAESDLDEWMQNAENADQTEQVSTAEEAPNPGPDTEDQTVLTNVVVTPPTHSDDSHEESSHPTANGSLLSRRQATNPASSEVRSVNGIDIPNRPNEMEMSNHLADRRTRTETPDGAEQIIAGEGPLTPRNNAGPFVFDGSAGRGSRAGSVVATPEVTQDAKS